MNNRIDSDVEIGAGTEIGYGVVVGPGVRIGAGCVIGHHVVIRPGCTIGDRVRIDDHAVIGKRPMRAANSAVTTDDVLSGAELGDDCIIGSSAVIYSGARLGRGVLAADLATIREKVTIGEKTIVGRGVAIENRCRIGAFCKLETNAYITAYSTLEDYVFIAPGVVTSNDNYAGRSEERFEHFKGVVVRRGGRIGAGAVILPGVEIAADTFVAAGSVVTADTEPAYIYIGAPARKSKPVPDNQLLSNQTWFD
ncbi:MAG: N-acetyltransferase [Rhodothermales bacterium]|nr:N-acetyltransferase [Rhodothermales bacterium]